MKIAEITDDIISVHQPSLKLFLQLLCRLTPPYNFLPQDYMTRGQRGGHYMGLGAPRGQESPCIIVVPRVQGEIHGLGFLISSVQQSWL